MPKNQELQDKIEGLKNVHAMFLKKKLKTAGFPANDIEEIIKENLLSELAKFVKEHEEVDDPKAVLSAFKVEQEKIKKADTAIAKELKGAAKPLNAHIKGLQENPYDIILVEQLEVSLTDWVNKYASITYEDIQKPLNAYNDSFSNALKKIVPVMKVDAKAIADKMKLDNAGAKIATLDVKELLKGLKAFYPAINAGKIADYKKVLETKHSDLTSFAGAAVALFQKEDAEGVLPIENFLKAKKIAKDYPSNTVGKWYRGDSRTEDELKAAGGFTGRNKLSLEEAKKQIKEWYGKDGAGPTAEHESWIRSKKGGDKVATGNDIGCMGYGCNGTQGALQNVWLIEIGSMAVIKPTEDALGFKVHSDAASGPKLLMDKPKLEDATMIAVVGKVAAETTFFTTIPMKFIKCIYEYTGNDKKKGEGREWL